MLPIPFKKPRDTKFARYFEEIRNLVWRVSFQMISGKTGIPADRFTDVALYGDVLTEDEIKRVIEKFPVSDKVREKLIRLSKQA